MRGSHVSLRDVRRVFDLLAEVRERGSDVKLWHPRVVEGLCALTGAQVGIGANLTNFERGEEPRGLGVFRTGWRDPEAERRWREYASSVPIRSTPEYVKVAGFRGPIVTLTRQQVYDDALWYRSRTFNEVHKACGLDHYIFSVAPLSGLGVPGRAGGTGGSDIFNSIWIHRPVGEPAFGRRDWWIVRTVHAEISEMIGGVLASPGEAGPVGLTERQRDVLDGLLEGDGEKQIASRLGLSPTTVHEHVAAVYRHFGVASRGELMARFVGRARPK